MNRIEVSKEYKNENSSTFDVSNFIKKINENLTEDMRACIAAGCAIDTIVKAHGGTMQIKIVTRYPVSILKDSRGRIIDIYQKVK